MIKIIGNGAIGKYLLTDNSFEMFPRFSLENYISSKENILSYGKGNTFIFTAGMSKPQDCEENFVLLGKIVNGTIKAIKDIAIHNKVLFLSSDVVKGRSTSYSWSKKEIEKNLLEINNVKVARLSYVFSDVKGFEDPFTKYAIQEEKAIEVYADLKRNIIHIKDVKDGIIEICSNFKNAPDIISLTGKNCIDKSTLLQYIKCEYNIITDTKAIEEFFKNRDKYISVEPNFYMPKIDLTKGRE